MEKLDFRPKKSKSDFRKNYKLHDLAEQHGKNLLTQWGVDFSDFGEDKRYSPLWERGKDKPDSILRIRNKSILIDWKAKHKSKWIVNKRAVKSYEEWSKTKNMPVIICFFVFDSESLLIERRFAFLNKHNYIDSAEKEWDANSTVEFQKELPIFNYTNLIKYIDEIDE
ncbi:MAG: hypothetical protein K9J16_15850 [Melioribacteraceae bacterium]|nr:hypothetical protein [Melioribacteraceae bacterium]MCF8394888.1 hypothetical protein [Melioribacteraceae bacterium]MCF8420421.1 hypothetical protein [Melioribacteraceae bacterium]